MPTTTTGVATEFINFTRASNATVTDSNGVIKWAAHNLLTNSESFDAAAWGKTSVTVTGPNAAVAPNGTTTADTITLGAGTASKFLSRTLAAVDAQCTLGLYVKIASGTVRYIQLLLNGDVQAYANFDITGNAVGTKGTNTPNSAITSLGSDWYYISATFTGTGNNPLVQVVDGASAGYSPSTSATGTFHLWGAHLYRSDLAMQANTSAYPMYNPTTPKNLLGYTQDFDNVAWTKTFGAISANAETAPNGTLTADKFTPTAAASTDHRLITGVITTTGGYTLALYVKPAGYSKFGFRNGAVGEHATFNLSGAGAVIEQIGCTATITAEADGWYKVQIVDTSASIRCDFWALNDAYTSGNPGAYSYTGDGTSGIYLWGAQLSDSASLDSYSPVYGAAVTSAAYYGPRRDFDPVTLACKGLLVEEQRTNAVTYSSDFSNWSGSTATVNTNVVTAPDGTLTADEVVRATAASDHRFLAVTLTGDGSKAVSIFVKYNTAPTFSILLFDLTAVASRAEAVFTFTAGVPSATSTPAGSVEAIEPWGNGWYRIKMVATGVIAANTNRVYVYPAATGSSNGQKTTFWGAQAEVQTASFSTSLIPTIGATATRLADVASVSTQAFPYSASEGTVVANGSVLSTAAANRGAFTLASAGGYIAIGNNVSGLGATNADFYTLPAGTFLTASGAVTAGTPFKAASVYKASDFALSANGAAAVTSSSGALPSAATDAYIGRIGSSSGYFNGHIRQITYLPRRISNAELQTRTA